ncbi:hypothetical protein CHS0354_008626, partial [Potamilus streckersoni]
MPEATKETTRGSYQHRRRAPRATGNSYRFGCGPGVKPVSLLELAGGGLRSALSSWDWLGWCSVVLRSTIAG